MSLLLSLVRLYLVTRSCTLFITRYTAAWKHKCLLRFSRFSAEYVILCVALAHTPGTGQPMLCNRFTANYGMPYKYIATSIAFSEAPDAITGALGRLRWAAEKVVPAGELKQPK